VKVATSTSSGAGGENVISESGPSTGVEQHGLGDDLEAQEAALKLAHTQESALAEQADRRTNTESRGIPELAESDSDGASTFVSIFINSCISLHDDSLTEHRRRCR
jgi:hypothetical protein